ncbi:MAG TPA: ABC transporter permease, partial [Rhodocyclaceae bacterium]|nr:ABC transporter permease [Rhodocyclaceae bacterium]
MSAPTTSASANPQVNMANLRGGIEYASQWLLMWYRFRKHRLALASMFVVFLLYGMALFSEFLAPYNPEDSLRAEGSYKAQAFHPPQMIHLLDTSNGGFKLHPYVYVMKEKVDPDTLSKNYVIDDDKKIYLSFFVHGFEYNFLGLFRSDIHLLGPSKPGQVFYLFGSDRNGRDMFSRIIYGGRFTLSLGLIGVILSTIFGIVLGGVAGYYGGKVDWFIQRMVEFITSLPTLPIWLAMAAVLPKNWP